MAVKRDLQPAKYRKQSLIPKEVPNIGMATCFGKCGKTKKTTEFYKTHTPNNVIGVVPYCKQCMKEMITLEDGSYDLDALKEILQHPSVDKPFLSTLWQASLDSKSKSKVGEYFKMLNNPQMQSLTWGDSDDNCKLLPKSEINKIIRQKKKDEAIVKEKVHIDDDFELEKWMIDLFGEDFSIEEYKRMVKKYNFLKENYTESTNMHTEALVTYVRYRVKEEMATIEGDSSQAKTWSELANKAATNAKINPSQLSKADLMGGISTISEITQSVEQAVDIIPILPQFKYRPNDAVDFTIWCYINYARELEGKPLVDYEDVYRFYDNRVEAYKKQYGDPYGIFDSDPTKKNRDSIKRFIKVDEEEAEDLEDGESDG